MVVLVAVGAALGLATNAVRSDGIRLSKSYFAKPMTTKSATPAPNDTQAPQAVAQAAPEQEAESADNPSDRHLKHVFQVVRLEEVMDLVHDPLYPGEIGVLVDARGDDAYEDGHIPYALQLNPYHSERYLPDVLPDIALAEMVVVYCQGGECEDSIFACRELLDNGVSFEKIYLFEGGMEAWEKADEPIDEGRE